MLVRVQVNGSKDKHFEFRSKYINYLIGLEIVLVFDFAAVSNHGQNLIPALVLKHSQIASTRAATCVPDFIADSCLALINGGVTTFFPPTTNGERSI